MGMDLHDHSTHHGGGMVTDIRHGLHAMPTWGWVVTAGGAGVLLLIWMRRSSASNAAGTVPVLASPATVTDPGAAGTGATVVGGAGSAGTNGPTGQDLYNLIVQSQQQTEQDLLAYLAGLGGTNTNGVGTGGGAGDPGGPLPPNLMPPSNPPPIDPGTAPVATNGGGSYGTTPPPAAMLDPIFYNDPQFVPGAGVTISSQRGQNVLTIPSSFPLSLEPAAPAPYANLDSGASVHQVGLESYSPIGFSHPAQQPVSPPPGSALTSFYDPNAATNALAQLLRQNGIGTIQEGH